MTGDAPSSVPHRDRVSVFRQFVLENFPGRLLGVTLDVAGGKGDLSWLLANADGVDSVVVDPRPTDHRKLARTALWYWERRHDPQEQQAGQERQALAKMGLAPPFRTPRHLRCFLDSGLICELQKLKSIDIERNGELHPSWEAFWNTACSRAEALDPPGHHQPKEFCPTVVDQGSIRDAQESLKVFESARLLLGFHADEATEPCIDLALFLQIPFAVCPCCVFAKDAPDRTLDGKRVTSYNDFVEYLTRKHPAMRSKKLDWGLTGGYSRNDVLYMFPEDFGHHGDHQAEVQAFAIVSPSLQEEETPQVGLLNKGREYSYTTKASDAGLVLLDLLGTWPHSSRAEWAAHCAEGRVLLKGSVAKADDIVVANAVVSYQRQPWYEPLAPLDLRVFFHDDAVLILCKPSGLPVLPSQMYWESTVVAILGRAHAGSGVKGDPPSAIHRLGVGTSGLLVCGVTHKSKSVLSRALQEHRVKKTYRALVSGIVEQDTVDVTCPIGPVPHASFGGTVHGASPDGGANSKTAQSIVRVLRRDTAKTQTLVEVNIPTGRPHQIRIHMAYLGHPLVGDPLYESGGLPRSTSLDPNDPDGRPPLPRDVGYLLHAARIEFAHPVTGVPMSLEMPAPEALCQQDETCLEDYYETMLDLDAWAERRQS